MNKFKYVEQESLLPKPKLIDPPLRNGLQNRRLLAETELQESQIINWPDIQGNPTDNAHLLAALQNLQPSLGYQPLSPLENLSELSDPDEAVINLGLGPTGENSIWLLRTGGTLTGLLVLAEEGLLMNAKDTLNTAQTGEFIHDGHHLYFTHVSTRRMITLAADPLVASETVQNDTTETEIYSTTIEANILDAGSLLRILMTGHYSNADGSSTFTLKFKVAGTTILSIVSTAASVANAPVFAELLSTVRTDGATGTLWSYLRGLINNVNKDKSVTGTTVIDTTGGLDFTITIQWSATDAGNVFIIDQALLNIN